MYKFNGKNFGDFDKINGWWFSKNIPPLAFLFNVRISYEISNQLIKINDWSINPLSKLWTIK